MTRIKTRWLQRALVAGLVGTATVATPITAGAVPVGYSAPDGRTVDEDSGATLIDVLGNDEPGAMITGFTPATSGTVGEVVVAGVTEAFTYTPDADVTGSDSFTYDIEVVVDGETIAETQTVSVGITAMPDAPTAVDDVAPADGDEILENGAAVELTDLILGNDVDVDGDSFALVGVDDTGTAGTVEFIAGSVWYTATSDSALTDSFEYTIKDDSDDALEGTGTVTVTITDVDDAPVAVDDATSADEGASIEFDVVANDTDIDGGLKAVDELGALSPALGSAVVDPDSGKVLYTAPDELAAATDVAIPYTLNGGSEAVLTVTVSPVNDDAVAADDDAEVDEAGSIAIDVLDNDTDEEEDDFIITGTTDPSVGTVDIAEDGLSLTYNHEGDDLAPVTFDYSITGGATATVTVTVTNSDDDLPVVDDVAIEVDEDSDPVLVPVLSNGQTDIDGTPLSISSVSRADLGDVNLLETGEVEYFPYGDAFGDDSFTVTVTDGTNDIIVNVDVTIIGSPDAPIANDDDFTNVYGYYDDYYDDGPFATLYSSALVFEDESAALYLLDNDEDPDGDDLSVVMDSIDLDPEYGTVEPFEGGVIFTPAPDFWGYVQFSYVVTDGELESEPATVSIVVIAQSDAPIAVDDEAETTEDGIVWVDVLDNDSDVDGDDLQIIEVSQPEGGYAAIAGDRIRVQPDPDFEGILEIEYLVQAEYEPFWDPRFGPTYPACDSPFGPFDYFDGPFPIGFNHDFEGSELEYDYNGFCPVDSATIIVFVGPANDAPIAENDAVDTDEDTPITIDVLDNDSDVDNDDLSIWRVGDAEFGTTEIVGNEIRYTPEQNFIGSDEFIYFVTDGDRLTLATVRVEVLSVNDLPTIEDHTRYVNEDQTASFQLIVGDVEDDRDDLSIGVHTQPQVGSVDIYGTWIDFTPPKNWFGTAEFSMSVTDRDGGVSVNDVVIIVSSVNDQPNIGNINGTIDEDGSFSSSLDLFDVEDGNDLDVRIGAAPTSGTASVDGSTVSYTPPANWHGDATFTIIATDSSGAEAIATAMVTVDPVNDAPSAVDCGPLEVLVGETIVVDAGACATDVDGDTLSALAGTASAGSVSVTDGVLSFTAPATPGSATVSFTVADGNGGQVDVSVEITVTEPVSPFAGASGLEGELVRTYSAMFGREPDMDGFEYWLGLRTSGLSYEAMIVEFANSTEFQLTFGEPMSAITTAEWVDFVYREVLGREADAVGRAYWIGEIESGRVTRAGLVIYFAESAEYRARTQTS